MICTTFLISSTVKIEKWKSGLTFLKFLEIEKLPRNLYFNADDADKKAIEDIQARSRYFILKDNNGNLQQVLIPLSEELQIHIYKLNGKYFLENIPIEFQEENKKFVTNIVGSSVYNNIKKITNSSVLAGFFVETLKDRINFKRDIHKGSIVAMLYKRKYRLGYPFGGVNLKIAMLETGNRKRYVINYKSKNYSANGNYVERHEFVRPVKKGTYRVSSRFTKKRWHPILKKYRAHLGIDYAAKRGTPIYSAGDGKIVFASKTRGYGNLVKIQHKGGYLTLYAHMKKFAKGVKVGNRVKIGQNIGFVGTTGLSTGPHLHFGLYKDGIATDPESVVSIKFKDIKKSIHHTEFKESRDQYKEQMEILVKDFKSGRFVTKRYKYEKLVCETTLTNIEIDLIQPVPSQDDLQLNRDIIADEQMNEDIDVDYIFSEKQVILHEQEYQQFQYSDDKEELELSEDYLLY